MAEKRGGWDTLHQLQSWGCCVIIVGMTRINIIDPKELTDQHLVAEYVETLMLCKNLVRTLNSKCGFQEKKVPPTYRLNKGHVYFFYNKGKYLHDRFNKLCEEMQRRGIETNERFPRHLWPDELYNDWKSTAADEVIIRERIALRISQKPGYYKYCGKHID